MGTRLNKFLVLSGLGSRRKVEDFITAGQIKVNNKITMNLATVIDPENDQVKFNNKIITGIKNFQYILLNKPRGYITTLNDEKGRAIVMDLIPEKYKRQGIFPVGRLDKDTEGLLFFTNDGDLANKMNHPKYKMIKEYIVQIDKPLEDFDLKKISKGIFIHQIKAKTKKAQIEKIGNKGKLIKFIISEGKKRQIRFSFLNFGYKVMNLKRTAYGPFKLTGINKGSYRVLKKKEISELKKLLEKDYSHIKQN